MPVSTSKARSRVRSTTLGPVAGRDVLLVDPADGRWGGRLASLGARVTGLADAPWEARLAVADASADVVAGLWSSFRAPSPDELAEADRVLRPDGRLLVVQDYGRDDVSVLRGDLPEYSDWSRRDGWYLSNGFRIRVIHCFWTFVTSTTRDRSWWMRSGPRGRLSARR